MATAAIMRSRATHGPGLLMSRGRAGTFFIPGARRTTTKDGHERLMMSTPCSTGRTRSVGDEPCLMTGSPRHPYPTPTSMLPTIEHRLQAATCWAEDQ